MDVALAHRYLAAGSAQVAVFIKPKPERRP
jgi:hypothetical protein